jgi:hypothetical protein
VPLLRRRLDRLGQHGDRLGPHGQFAGPRLPQQPIDADV